MPYKQCAKTEFGGVVGALIGINHDKSAIRQEFRNLEQPFRM